MSNKTNYSEYTPDYYLHPGHFLEEELETIGLKQSDLAKRSGLTSKTINAIIKGKAPISPDTAVILEAVLGRPAVYWLNLDSLYQVKKANDAQYKLLKKDTNLLSNIDLSGMIKQKWISQYNDKVEQLKEVLSFFGVATTQQLLSVWSKLEVNYRTSSAYKKNHLNIMSWLRRGELLAQEIECEPYSVNKFKIALTECRSLTNLSFPEISKQIQFICAKAGVAVVFVPQIKNISTSGAAHWVNKDKALIQLSLRGKSDDKFWFNFYHEAGHILLHGRKDQFIDNEGSQIPSEENIYFTPERMLIEAEADNFSANFLINKKSFSNFILKNKFTTKTIIEFANKEGISPGIVVGQLQKNKFLGWHMLNTLKRKYDFP